MLVLARYPDEAFKAPLKTKKQAPVTGKKQGRFKPQGMVQVMCVCLKFTFAGLVMNTDGLCLIVAIVILHAHQVRVSAVVEARPHSQHMLIGLVHGLH